MYDLLWVLALQLVLFRLLARALPRRPVADCRPATGDCPIGAADLETARQMVEHSYTPTVEECR